MGTLVDHQSPPRPAVNLRDYVEIVRHGRGIVALVTMLVVGTTLFVSYRQTRLYVSEARVLVRPIGVRSLWPQLINVETERGLVRSTAVAAIVRDALGLPDTPDQLLAGLDASVEMDTEILQIRYSDPDPHRAQRLADGFAGAYLQFRRDQAQEELQSETAVTQRRILQTETSLADIEDQMEGASTRGMRNALSAQRDSLVARLGVLQLALEDLHLPGPAEQAGGEVVQAASLPGAPSTPTPVRDGLLALVVGIALGVGMAFLREHLHDRLRGRQDLEELSGAPVLATVPRLRRAWPPSRPQLVMLKDPVGVMAEAYRTLRTNVHSQATKQGMQVLLVTAPTGGEGKTTTVANLAVSLAQTGIKVVAVSCDLRRPRLHRLFGVRNRPGLTSVLNGDVALSRALVQLPSERSVWVLPSGPVPPDPAELLASEGMAAVLGELRAFAEFVLVDVPPVLPVADAVILAPKLDGVLIVADAARTARGAVAQAREQLELADARVVGAVLNNVDPSSLNHYIRRYPYHSAHHLGNGDAAIVRGKSFRAASGG
jgi:succinoglycan biosynthesis transport protein ExoP